MSETTMPASGETAPAKARFTSFEESTKEDWALILPGLALNAWKVRTSESEPS